MALNGLTSILILYKGDEVRFTYNEENSDWWWRSTDYRNQYLKPLRLLPSMPEVSIDDANKVIIAKMERRGSLNSESQFPNPEIGKKNKNCMY